MSSTSSPRLWRVSALTAAIVALATLLVPVPAQTRFKLDRNKYTPEQDVKLGQEAAGSAGLPGPMIRAGEDFRPDRVFLTVNQSPENVSRFRLESLMKLLGQGLIGHEPRRVRSDDDAGEEVADDGRESQPVGDISRRQCGREAAGQREDQVNRVHSSS